VKFAKYAALVVCMVPVVNCGQSPLLEKLGGPATKAEAVRYLYPEQVVVAAGKTTDVALHFRIADGMHINSHTPKYDFLIPTALSFPASSGVALDAANYPTGTEFVLPADPSTKLNVYSGEFTINARITAEPGNHLVQAKLRYQACDQTQCMPPKTINVAMDIVAR